MKLSAPPDFLPLYNEVKLDFHFPKSEQQKVWQLRESIGEIDPNKDYEIIIRVKRKKRSLDSNAYLWTLIGKLAEVLHSSPIDVYREYIRDYGAYEIVPIREDAIERFIETWESRGNGWLCEDMGKCKRTPGFHNIKTFYGSSKYNTKEMSRLIDAVVQDCKEQNIETLPPDELEHLKEMWR